MNTMKRTLLAMLIGMLSIPGIAMATKPNNYSEKFRAAYERAKDGNARKTLCIKAIDDGIIALGMPIASIDRLLEGKQSPKYIESGKYFRRVHFEQLVPGKDDSEGGFSSGYYPGWYLFIEVNDRGVITAYYLTNIPKMTLAPGA